ncbi:MAG: tripartite tricarboxylate transporter TctB family protein [Vibrio sp.]|uniref:tripartite tricarboxylate transporter TctB family protein n=1 Tax=Vibrio sp. TaxID=678 RepID=UPI003A8AF44E
MKESVSKQDDSNKIDYLTVGVYVFFLLVSVFAIVSALSFPSFTMSNDVGTSRFPIIFSSALGLLCIIGIVQNLLNKVSYDVVPIGIGKASVGIVLNILAFVIIPYVGFYISCFLFSTVLMKFLGINEKLKIMIMPISLVIAIYFVFHIFLNVPLPIGILFE